MNNKLIRAKLNTDAALVAAGDPVGDVADAHCCFFFFCSRSFLLVAFLVACFFDGGLGSQSWPWCSMRSMSFLFLAVVGLWEESVGKGV